jgi:hypothetical protein
MIFCIQIVAVEAFNIQRVGHTLKPQKKMIIILKNDEYTLKKASRDVKNDLV